MIGFSNLGQGWILTKKNPVQIHRNLIKITLSLGVGDYGPHSQPPFKMAIWDLFSVHATHLLFCERILKCFQEKDAEIWDISTEEKKYSTIHVDSLKNHIESVHFYLHKCKN